MAALDALDQSGGTARARERKWWGVTAPGRERRGRSVYGDRGWSRDPYGRALSGRFARRRWVAECSNAGGVFHVVAIRRAQLRAPNFPLSLSAVAALVLIAAIVLSSAVQRSRAAGRSTSAHVWITTADGSDKLTDAGTVPFTARNRALRGRDRPVAQLPDDVGLRRRDHRLVGGRALPAVPHRTQRRDAMLFDPRAGDGLSYLRQPIGASDFVATAHYTYDDMPAGQTDYASVTSASPTTRPRSCRCCGRPNA